MPLYAKRAVLGVFTFAFCCISVALLVPLYHRAPLVEPSGVLNDFSRLNPTPIREVIHPTNEEQIRDAVLRAAADGARVTIAGKRHSMGGQTLFPGAIALDMLQFNKILSLDEANKILTVLT